MPAWSDRLLRRVPAALRLLGLFVAVGLLIDFLPLDLAVMAVLVASLHLSIAAGIVWTRLRGWARRLLPQT